jgi:hypothetical protein
MTRIPSREYLEFTSKPAGRGSTITVIDGMEVPEGILTTPVPAPEHSRGLTQRSLDALDQLVEQFEEGLVDAQTPSRR